MFLSWVVAIVGCSRIVESEESMPRPTEVLEETDDGREPLMMGGSCLGPGLVLF